MNNTWDDEVTLIKEVYKLDEAGQLVYDAIGQPIQDTDKKEKVCCYEKPISRSEHYAAGQNDIQVLYLLVVHPYEYEGETTVIYNDQRLHIEKTYLMNAEEIELTCIEKLGDQ
ncbi:phage head closure protein [Enterococcus sp. BWR-S5]|uniref:phage head closure protein n=1 Tax=Enterococcus sp. BWR-S5 TaxID=2787714 RepID=UPI001920A575|nr:phage head closure protein [Enterococcus sp. BWR-S5]MBL1226603.1 phage head closure protein [Enterococcus sp. BWR-S5]